MSDLPELPLLRWDTDKLAWQDDALCTEIGGDIFFPTKGAGADAKKVCARCDVRVECREFAVEGFIRHGVYGGTSGKERKAIWRERRMTPPDEELTA